IERIPLAGSFDPSRGKREVKISSKGLKSIDFGTHRIDLGAVEQLVDMSQTRAIGDAIHFATRYMDGKKTLGDIVLAVMEEMEERGLDALSKNPEGEYAHFRGLEFAAAINRLRTLTMKKK
ncbi:MAG: ATPase, partial [Spirochaetes bacterium]|nr:ATPase [Spirochaetota bacterium]